MTHTDADKAIAAIESWLAALAAINHGISEPAYILMSGLCEWSRYAAQGEW